MNQDQEQIIFAFPPVLGYGLMYQNLSSRLPSYKLCAFDFIEEEDRLDRYADLIQKLQPEGTFNIVWVFSGMQSGV